MAYMDGFVLAVPEGNKDDYLAMAAVTATIFRESGATRVVEAWGNDVPHGTNTDFYMATKAEEGEVIVFSWILWPSKEVRDAGWEKMTSDERMKAFGEMPFDGKRMFWGGFDPILDEGEG
ncbi:DUF1428 domain-containing protein [Sphingomonas sp. M1-B02]|uniref:DUF1428 domain-containing protein n=1 Tax=Sphingomonas sp. M1-B02 TaxID=3114300 RepID=UPI0022402945|nr:DUF1428 domain-containing protein [Sphingomonas sp. S6-11]UZK64740.1 DUF1428 domain-containing protein [Sphingomonas sp. S6-11]